MQTIRSTLSSLLRAHELRWLGAMVAALAMLGTAVAESATVDRLDAETSTAVQARATHEGAEFNFLFSHLGSTEIVLLLTLGAVAVLALTRHWRGAFALTLSVVATQAAVQVMKLVVERPRPGASIIDAAGFSFPSGHAATSVAFYSSVALIAANACRGRPARVAIGVGAAVVVVGVGLTRVYLGAHYPTDVLAGWLTGGILVVGSWFAAARLRLLERPATAV
jgi:membrane-associated phospholipid phosphatase